MFHPEGKRMGDVDDFFYPSFTSGDVWDFWRISAYISICLLACLRVYLFVCLFCLVVCLFVCLVACLFLCLFVCLMVGWLFLVGCFFLKGCDYFKKGPVPKFLLFLGRHGFSISQEVSMVYDWQDFVWIDIFETFCYLRDISLVSIWASWFWTLTFSCSTLDTHTSWVVHYGFFFVVFGGSNRIEPRCLDV